MSAIEKLRKLQQTAISERAAKGITNEDLSALRSTIACYFADGSLEYTAMTALALRSMLVQTPAVAVGLLVPDVATRDRVLSALPHGELGRVQTRIISTQGHLAVDWNATQCKLAIQEFLVGSQFTTLVWMDSDTLVFNDMTDFLLQFLKQKEKAVYLVKDHCNNHKTFQDNWSALGGSIPVPQACVMAFKKDCVSTLFDMWRKTWNEWLLPTPFASLADPTNGERHSAFCIEQYALGLALARLEMQDKILWFDRSVINATPSKRPSRPILSASFQLPDDFATSVERRWRDFGSNEEALKRQEATGDTQEEKALQVSITDATNQARFRPGWGNKNSSYSSSYHSSYTGANSSYQNVSKSTHQVAPKPQKVKGIALEQPLSALGSMVARSETIGDYTFAVDETESSLASQQTLPETVAVDMFGGAVYHCYSRWFFYVLKDLVASERSQI